MPGKPTSGRAGRRTAVVSRLGASDGVDRLIEACRNVEEDARLQFGAYITDGVDLYEVKGISCGAGRIGFASVRLILEDCRSLRTVEFLLDKIRRRFRLVREPSLVTLRMRG